MSVEPQCRTLVLNGKLAAVWQLHEDGSIEHFHFSALPDEDENRLIGHIVSRPGDQTYPASLGPWGESEVVT